MSPALNTYQREHLLPAYEQVARVLLPWFVEASRAHVVMLSEQRLLDADQARDYLIGLGKIDADLPLPEYDGTFEDAYFVLERLLADQLGVAPSALNLQLARSRNDLDAAVFRLILRDQHLRTLQQLSALVDTALQQAHDLSDQLIIGTTHRRPAQPTTIGHVLAGFAEAALATAEDHLVVLDRLERSPLGACAFTGTDLPISSERLAELLGFASVNANSYFSIASSDPFAALASANARLQALIARLARTFQDWLDHGWVVTPDEFCQGSSIMPQKRNPVVLEHLASYAGRAVADASSVLTLVASSWWEDSNNATTDVQSTLWRSNEETRRATSLIARFIEILTVQELPSSAAIADTGATTTAAADALTLGGIPFRAAHHLTGALAAQLPPSRWDADALVDAGRRDGMAIGAETADAAARAARDPETVLARTQPDGPGTAAVRAQVDALRTRLVDLETQIDTHTRRIAQARTTLSDAASAVLAR